MRAETIVRKNAQTTSSTARDASPIGHVLSQIPQDRVSSVHFLYGAFINNNLASKIEIGAVFHY